jgi:Do/DeqQ family serine protease
MEATKRKKALGLFLLVVVVSAATNLTTNYFAGKHQKDGFDRELQYPTAYAKFSDVKSGLETDFTLAAELTVHSVVHVKTQSKAKMAFSQDPFFEFFFGRPQYNQEPPVVEGSGSGVIISNDGYIVTNNHVIEGSSKIEVTLNDKRTFEAKVIGADPNTDLALIKIDAENLPIIPFGNSDSLKVGEWVLAVGNPFNLNSTVTAGIVSAKARNINIINSKMRIESFIQTDAAVNPGNSGGALVNTRGELVGINTAIASQTGSFAGYAFAIPVSIVKKVVSDLRQYGVVQRAVLGVEIADISAQLAKEKDLKTLEGAYVANVSAGSAAEKAGIKEGDVIVNVNGVAVKSVSELQEQIGRYRPGDKISITVIRKNNELKFNNVELKNSQGSASIVSSDKVDVQQLLGATFKELNNKLKKDLDLDYGVQITSLTKGKLMQQGVKVGYIILKINNQTIRSVDDIQSAVTAALNSEDKVLFIAGVYPNGRITYYAINLEE